MKINKTAGICPTCKKRNHPLAPDIPGDICDDCMDKLLETSSLIVCSSCKRVAGMIKHGATENGFIFEPGVNYSVDSCRQCNPNVQGLEITELEKYTKEHGGSDNSEIKKVMDIIR